MIKNKKPPVKFIRPDAFNLAYGITKDDYNKLLEKQSNCCSICKQHMVNFKNRLLVDKTDEGVKGLLCPECLENIKYLRDKTFNIIEYLKENNNG